ncbi:flagellar biosynthesis protein FlhA [Novosphingobium fuchskuhlense]|uniref:Flagellar biosynthesis protein FlhA n=1 Tax=Novosphingobium fuchskuhlense TaxID=1117702 RepID=A0A117US98_9SPHN|nr:flagellar biosynthesis protein FlhA [Novosphingobium fuchskuhlense]KUR69908.1 flagellar biosynthesis protein FlhA [Novosphingobium fuchskuhlense]
MIARFLKNNQDLALVGAVFGILIILFAPVPAAILDISIIANFGLALTILLLTFYVSKPVEFSTFPSLLLVATLFRLALNVAATRLILTGANAGQVIGSIGTFAVQGNFVVGLVVFSILVVVQYIVVTSGAQRVSEVAARFTLDSMPGQQMSIDADLNMGLIDQTEAVRRRTGLEREASFYGAMDGASKFVKGDAIAGIIILLIDIIAGWIVGIAQLDMEWGEALQHFTLLTIGDGIAAQLPALIISVATGIIVTRSSSDADLSTEIFRQLASIPRIPFIVTGVLAALLLLPGMPKWPIIFMLGLGYLAWRRMRRETGVEQKLEAAEHQAKRTAVPSVAPIEVRFGPELADAWKNLEAVLLDRIEGMRKAQETGFGIDFPQVRFIDGAALGAFEYEIRLFGARFGHGEARPDKVLAIARDQVPLDIEGTRTTDPTFGLPAIWVDEADAELLRSKGLQVVDPVTVLMTHFSEIISSEMSTLVTRPVIMRLLEGVRQRQPGLLEEIIPGQLSISDIQRVLQNMLGEGVSIANIDLIMENLADLARTSRDPGDLTELVRQRLSYAICSQLRGTHPDLAVVSLDPRIENQITASLQAAGIGSLPIEPSLAEKLIRKLSAISEAMLKEGRSPVLLCGPDLRRHLRAFTRRTLPKLSILSVNEIPMRISLKSYDIVRIEA